MNTLASLVVSPVQSRLTALWSKWFPPPPQTPFDDIPESFALNSEVQHWRHNLGFTWMRVAWMFVAFMLCLLGVGLFILDSDDVKIVYDVRYTYILENMPAAIVPEIEAPDVAASKPRKRSRAVTSAGHGWVENVSASKFTLARDSANTYHDTTSPYPQDARVFEVWREGDAPAINDGKTTYIKYPDGVEVFQVEVLMKPGCGIQARPKAKKAGKTQPAQAVPAGCPPIQVGTTYVSLPPVGERMCLTAPPAKALVVTSSVRPIIVANFRAHALMSRDALPDTLIDGVTMPSRIFRFIETGTWTKGNLLPHMTVEKKKWDHLLAAWEPDEVYTFKAFPMPIFDPKLQKEYADIDTAKLGAFMCFGRDPKTGNPS